MSGYTASVYTEYPYQMNNHGLPPGIIFENRMGLIQAQRLFRNASRWLLRMEEAPTKEN